MSHKYQDGCPGCPECEAKIDDFYYPNGIPITPQARQFGYEFPVYVSKRAWTYYCAWPHGGKTNTDRRIIELLQHCYNGMMKKLATQDDFLTYQFKLWFWRTDTPKATKKARSLIGARLFLDPDTGGPWLYLFDIKEDSASELKPGTNPANGDVADDSAGGCAEDSGQPLHVHGKDGVVLAGSTEISVGEDQDQRTDGRD